MTIVFSIVIRIIVTWLAMSGIANELMKYERM